MWDIRPPRTLLAMILGDTLSVSDFLLQTFFTNPIAGPFVLEISSDTELVVSLVMIVLLRRGVSIGSAGVILAAFAGSMISTGSVLVISGKVKKMSMLVIYGVTISYICSTITDLVVIFTKDTNIVSPHNWSMGSFSGISWENVSVMMAVVSLSPILVFPMVKPIKAYQMGEMYAQNTGVNILRFRATPILLSSTLSICMTALAGPVSFVEIAAPHLVKSLFRTAKPILMISGCSLGGAVSCLFYDLTARIVFASTELSISSVTTIFGAPVVTCMMVYSRKGM